MKKHCKNGHTFTETDFAFCPICADPLVIDTSPDVVDLYVHGEDEHAYEKGQEIGLTGDALDEFARCLYEVKITLRVDHFNGKAQIIAVDDVPLSQV